VLHPNAVGRPWRLRLAALSRTTSAVSSGVAVITTTTARNGRSLTGLDHSNSEVPGLAVTLSLFLQLRFQTFQHHVPILRGMVARLIGEIVVLGERDASRERFGQQIDRDGMVVFRSVGQS
jgi:hypothetical protein